MSVLERCPSYRESNKGSEERQEPNLGVRFGEVSVQREATVFPKGGVERKPVVPPTLRSSIRPQDLLKLSQ